VPDSAPQIARQHDCQTCFMCELYCPEDALFVAPQVQPVSAGALDDNAFGQYRQAIGRARQRQPTASLDASYELLARAH
jgi:formate hydrogenlyase subunit 6/NADH:ubiquinone oxidoreductase subunit I